MSAHPVDNPEIARLLTITNTLIDNLQHGSIRAQGFGHDRKLAQYIGVDWDSMFGADWDAAKAEDFQRYGVMRLEFATVADFWPGGF